MKEKLFIVRTNAYDMMVVENEDGTGYAFTENSYLDLTDAAHVKREIKYFENDEFDYTNEGWVYSEDARNEFDDEESEWYTVEEWLKKLEEEEE